MYGEVQEVSQEKGEGKLYGIPRNMPDGVATVCNPSGGVTLGSRRTSVRDQRKELQEEKARGVKGAESALSHFHIIALSTLCSSENREADRARLSSGTVGSDSAKIRSGEMDALLVLVRHIIGSGPTRGMRTCGQKLQGVFVTHAFSNLLVAAIRIGKNGATRAGRARQSNSRVEMVIPGGQGRYISGAELSGPGHAGYKPRGQAPGNGDSQRFLRSGLGAGRGQERSTPSTRSRFRRTTPPVSPHFGSVSYTISTTLGRA